MMNRRTFVSLMGCLAAAGSLGVGMVLPGRRRLSIPELGPLTVQPMAGTTVVLHSAQGGRLAGVVEDVRVNRQPARRGAPASEQISLLVRPASPEAPGGIYHLTSDALDLGDLDFTAVGRQGGERRLEAVVTRLV